MSLNLRKAKPGSMVRGRMLDENGDACLERHGVALEASMTIDRETLAIQDPKLERRPVRTLQIKFDEAGEDSYICRMAEAKWDGPIEVWRQGVKDILPHSVTFIDGLRDAVVALSLAPELYPIYESDVYATSEGMFLEGKRITNSIWRIDAEYKGASGDTLYTVVGPDFVRIELTFQELLDGKYAHRFGSGVEILDKTGAFQYLRREWAATTPEQRQQYTQERHSQERFRAAEALKAKQELDRKRLNQ